MPTMAMSSRSSKGSGLSIRKLLVLADAPALLPELPLPFHRSFAHLGAGAVIENLVLLVREVLCQRANRRVSEEVEYANLAIERGSQLIVHLHSEQRRAAEVKEI